MKRVGKVYPTKPEAKAPAKKASAKDDKPEAKATGAEDK